MAAWIPWNHAAGVEPQVVKRYTVVVLYSWPGRRSFEGNSALFGESGKCCVSIYAPSRPLRRAGRADRVDRSKPPHGHSPPHSPCWKRSPSYLAAGFKCLPAPNTADKLVISGSGMSENVQKASLDEAAIWTN